MSRDARNTGNRRIRLSYRFAIAVGGGVLLTAIACAFSGPSVQFALLGILVSISIGFAWECLSRQRPRGGDLRLLETPFFLSHDTQVFDRYRQISQSLLTISQKPDPIYREVALE
jgi:hypothetical protein